tara:strand:+ start:3358 stop:3504 length:147 start_codon:yes stop_codon:yes gene_type:complete
MLYNNFLRQFPSVRKLNLVGEYKLMYFEELFKEDEWEWLSYSKNTLPN